MQHMHAHVHAPKHRNATFTQAKKKHTTYLCLRGSQTNAASVQCTHAFDHTDAAQAREYRTNSKWVVSQQVRFD